MTITWHIETRNIYDLKPFDNNPRRVTKDAYKTLVKNIKENGYTNRLIVDSNNCVLAGNQRLNALKELGFKEIEVLVANRELTQDELDRINITDNIIAGTWDTDSLGNNWDPQKLIEWGLPKEFLGLDDELEDEVPREKKPKTCPHCGEIL